MKTLLKLMPVALVLAACSNGGSGGGGGIGGPGARGGVLTGQTAIFEATQQKGGDSVGMTSVVAAGAMSAMQDVSAKAAVKSKADLVSKSIHTAKCQIVQGGMPGPGTPPPQGGGMPAMEVKVVGDACPLQLSMKVTMAMTPSSQSSSGESRFGSKTTIQMTYLVKDPQLMAQLEVVSGSITMQMDQDMTMPAGGGGNMVTAFNRVFTLSAYDLAGKEHKISGKHIVNMKQETGAPTTPGSVAMPMLYGGMQEKLDYEVGGKSLHLSAEIELKGNSADEKYLIDGKQVDKAEYFAEHDKLANSKMEFTKEQYAPSKPGTGPGPQPGPGAGPQPGPGSQPGPGPMPNPFPMPGPGPQPGPQPAPGPMPQPAPFPEPTPFPDPGSSPQLLPNN